MATFEVKTARSSFPYARWQMLPLDAVRLTGGFWARWQDTNRRVTLLHGYEMLEQAGNFHNLRLAAGLIEGKFRGFHFLGSDLYKWLEAASYAVGTNPDPVLQQKVDGVIDLIAAAQQDDGYLNTYYQVVNPAGRWTDLDFGHELYSAGHLFQAAVAHYRATGSTRLLDVATRFADLIASTFGPNLRQGAPGHPEIEMAVVELYRVTGKAAYLDLARFFIDQRGKNVMRGMVWMKAEYHQDRVPVRQAEIVEGHVVRALYLNAGVTDLYLETGEAALLVALDRQWRDMTGGKLFITGGVGSRYEGEAFGDDYELPPDRCYCETCAAIASVLWNWRLLLVTGDGRYADLIERTLYDGVLSGLALDGKHFFYINPLLSRGDFERQPWYDCACCPPNLMRLLASLAQYFVTHDQTGLQVHLYNTSTARLTLNSGQPVVLSMQTDYPWQGEVTLSIDETDGSIWQLRLRKPDWCPVASVAINGETIENPAFESGYLVLERAWQPGDTVVLALSMRPELIEGHPHIDAIRDTLAIQRGPLIYCFEAADYPQINLMDVRLDKTAPLAAVWREDLVAGGLMAIQTSGYVLDNGEWRDRLYRRLSDRDDLSLQPIPLIAIPYYAWANRGPGAMRVWIPYV
jgi:DUF1680 family protein